MRSSQSAGISTLVILLLAFGGFGYILYNNARPAEPLRAVVPTQAEPTAVSNAWQNVLRPGFGSNSTPLPTIPIPTQPFVAPTLEQAVEGTPVAASRLSNPALYTLEAFSVGVTPTPAFRPTEVASAVAVQSVVDVPTEPWQPPALIPPVNRDPLGRDHYWFSRPIDSNKRNSGLPHYPYGSDGLESNARRPHHGIDMPNDIGTTVRAAGPGTVIFVSTPEDPYFQNTALYGVAVFIEHDFSWEGQPLYTLYAHLQQPLVTTGQHVEEGEAIALTGNTGGSTGAHVHFEVRMGGDRYRHTYNPALWMVPYVGHGTIAGRLVTERGNYINDTTITLRNWTTGLVEATTSTYVFLDNVDDVNPDPNWNENFAFGDVPVGRYTVIADYEGQRLSQTVEVQEGRTTLIELSPVQAATAQPADSES